MGYVVKINGAIVTDKVTKQRATVIANNLRKDKKRLPSKAWMKTIRVVKYN